MKKGIIGAVRVAAEAPVSRAKFLSFSVALTQLKNSIIKSKRELLPERRDVALKFIWKQNPDRWMEWSMDCVKNNRIIFEASLTI